MRGQLTGLMSVGVTVKISSNEKNPSAKKTMKKFLDSSVGCLCVEGNIVVSHMDSRLAEDHKM